MVYHATAPASSSRSPSQHIIARLMINMLLASSRCLVHHQKQAWQTRPLYHCRRPHLDLALQRGWRIEYNAVTDPRIGLVRKLIGVKRKLPSMGSKSDNPPSKKAFWTVGQDDWDRGEDLTHEMRNLMQNLSRMAPMLKRVITRPLHDQQLLLLPTCH
jgi:hypothetical protein